MTLRIYTKTGDTGETGLFGGTRVAKDHIRVEAYGAVDELNAALGQVRALPLDAAIDAVVSTVQSLLFELGAQLATPPDKKQQPAGVDVADIVALEQHIDAFEATLAPLKTFILPGGTAAAAALHMARCICRRAERRAVTLQTHEVVSAACVTFLNRLSDLLFVLARAANARAGVSDTPWQSRR